MAHKNERVSHYKTDHGTEVNEVELEPVVKMVKDSWEKWNQHWSFKLTEFDTWYDRWRGKPPVRSEEWQSNFNKMLTWQAEKTLVPRFHSALFPISAPIDVDATETVDQFESIIAKSAVSHWFKIGKFSLEFLKSMRSSAIYGTGLFEDDWFLRVEKVPRKEQISIPDFRPMVDESGNQLFDEFGNMKVGEAGKKKITRTVEKNEVVEDRYRVRKANIYAWRIHPDKKSDEDDFPVIKQEFVTFNDLLKMQEQAEKKGYKKFENLDAIRQDNFKPSNADLQRQKKENNFVDKHNPKIEILHYWGLYDDTPDKDTRKEKIESSESRKRPMWIMVVNRKFRLALQDNPFWHKKAPLFHIVWTEDERENYYGIGLAEIGKQAEDRANTTVNIRIDERKKNLKGGGVYNAKDKTIKKKDLMKNLPGLWTPCSDINNAVRPNIPIPSTPDDYKEEEIAVSDHRDITGASAALAPANDKKQIQDTFRGFRLQVGLSLEKLKPDITTMELMGVRKIANRAFLLTMQFQTRNETIELIASKSELKQIGVAKLHNLQPGMITKKVNFHATGFSETAKKAENIENLLKYAEVTVKIPPLQAITNYANIGKQIALLIGMEDVEELVSMNPFNPYQQQAIPGQPGVPGQPGQPGAPQGRPQGVPGQPNLPPQLLQQIASQVTNQAGVTT